MRPLFLFPLLLLACGGANDDVLADTKDEIRAEQCPKAIALSLDAPELTDHALTHAEDGRALGESEQRSATSLRTVLDSDGWRRELDLSFELTTQNRIRCVYETLTASRTSAELRGRAAASSLEISRKPFLYRIAPRAYSTSGLDFAPDVRVEVFAELEREGGDHLLVKLGDAGMRPSRP